VSFGRDIANLLDMKVPAFIWLTPEDFVNQLREMNGTPNRQAPLKDAANTIDTPATTAVAHHAPAQHQAKQTAAAASATSNH
jgi:hypothetical protein